MPLTYLAQVNQGRHLAKLSQVDYLFKKFIKEKHNQPNRWAREIQNHTQNWWIFSVKFILIIDHNDVENDMRNSSVSMKERSFCYA